MVFDGGHACVHPGFFCVHSGQKMRSKIAGESCGLDKPLRVPDYQIFFPSGFQQRKVRIHILLWTAHRQVKGNLEA
jgi:hypothetical protein